MTRIKYKLIDGFKTSEPILTGHGFVIARHQNLDWEILNYDTNVLILKGTAIRLPDVTRILKKQIRQLGANFTDEIRGSK